MREVPERRAPPDRFPDQRRQRQPPRHVLFAPPDEPRVERHLLVHRARQHDDAATALPPVRRTLPAQPLTITSEEPLRARPVEAMHMPVRDRPPRTRVYIANRELELVTPHVAVVHHEHVTRRTSQTVRDRYRLRPRRRVARTDHNFPVRPCRGEPFPHPLERTRPRRTFAGKGDDDTYTGHGSKISDRSALGCAEKYHCSNTPPSASSPWASRRSPHSRQCAPNVAGRSVAR